MSDSIPVVAGRIAPVRKTGGALIALWSVQVALAGMFLLAGGSKLAGVAAMVALFDAIGVGQWFRYVTGGIEVGSAVALLVPALAPFGAVALAATMAGAVATHLFVVGGSSAMPVVLLVAALAVAWARRDQLARALWPMDERASQAMTTERQEQLLRANLVRVFGERNRALRQAAIAELYAPDAVLYEPEAVATGYDAIDEAVEALLASLPPAFVFSAQGPVVGHHGVARLRWSAGPANGPVAVTGTDVAQLTDGRIQKLYVLLDPAGA